MTCQPTGSYEHSLLPLQNIKTVSDRLVARMKKWKNAASARLPDAASNVTGSGDTHEEIKIVTQEGAYPSGSMNSQGTRSPTYQ